VEHNAYQAIMLLKFIKLFIILNGYQMIKFMPDFPGCKFATIYGQAVLKERL
jgi:hypothetical protein